MRADKGNSHHQDVPLANLKSILSGEKTMRLYLEFLSKNNHSDLLILKRTKVCLACQLASALH